MLEEVLELIREERAHQLYKWGEQTHPDLYWLAILTEELGEVAKALQENESKANLIGELTQVAAVAVAWIQAIRKGMCTRDSTCPLHFFH